MYIYLEKSFIAKIILSLNLGLYHEDFGLIPLVLLKATTVSSVDFYGYCYYQSGNSITRDKDYEKIKKQAWDVLSHYDTMLETIKKYTELKINTLNNIKQYYTNSIFLKAKELNKEDRKNYIKEIKKRKLEKNIKVTNVKQFIKRAILKVSTSLYISLV